MDGRRSTRRVARWRMIVGLVAALMLTSCGLVRDEDAGGRAAPAPSRAGLSPLTLPPPSTVPGPGMTPGPASTVDRQGRDRGSLGAGPDDARPDAPSPSGTAPADGPPGQDGVPGRVTGGGADGGGPATRGPAAGGAGGTSAPGQPGGAAPPTDPSERIAAKEWNFLRARTDAQPLGPGCAAADTAVTAILDLASVSPRAGLDTYAAVTSALASALERLAREGGPSLASATVLTARDVATFGEIIRRAADTDDARELGDRVLGAPGGPVEQLLTRITLACPSLASGGPIVKFFWLD